MSGAAQLGLFFEDEGHRALLEPLCARLAAEEGVAVELHPRSATGGLPRALAELRRYARDLRHGTDAFLDVLVVAIDANCHGYTRRRGQVRQAVGEDYPGLLVTAIPDPHVERWYLADPAAIGRALDRPVPVTPLREKCERARYKAALRDVFRQVDVDPPAGGIEYGEDVARVMDLAVACRAEKSLGRFVDDLRAALRAGTG